jgi:hypothetical protein
MLQIPKIGEKKKRRAEIKNNLPHNIRRDVSSIAVAHRHEFATWFSDLQLVRDFSKIFSR